MKLNIANFVYNKSTWGFDTVEDVFVGPYNTIFTITSTGYITEYGPDGSVLFVFSGPDAYNQKGLFILDVLKGTERFIPNNISPKFKKVYLLNEEDIESLGDVSTKDYIDLFISNSLLINNRKLRRKLEVMLETGNFASVEYLDDLAVENINKEDKIVEHKEIDIENIQTIELEYTEMIKTYINNQKHDSDKIKKGNSEGKTTFHQRFKPMMAESNASFGYFIMAIVINTEPNAIKYANRRE